jgi:hypothetical protein
MDEDRTDFRVRGVRRLGQRLPREQRDPLADLGVAQAAAQRRPGHVVVGGDPQGMSEVITAGRSDAIELGRRQRVHGEGRHVLILATAGRDRWRSSDLTLGLLSAA